MDLRSEQVSDDGYEWSQGLLNRGDPDPAVPPKQVLRRPQQQRQPVQQQQQGPPLRCPRCDSTNTKFCYYNNYSRTQPRHFCKACKRHWTNGGTLRNVPVGGRRKAKRPKTSRQSSAPNSAADAHGTIVSDGHVLPTTTQPSQQVLPPPPFGSLLQSPLPPSDYVDDCDVSSSYLCTLLHLPPVPQFGGCMMSSHDGTITTPSPFPSHLSFTEQDDLAAEDAGIVVPTRTTWELLPPTSGSSGPSGGCSTVTTTASSDLTVPETSFPSSGYWGSCWDDLIGFPSADHHKQYPPPLLPPPQDLPLA